MLNGRDAGKLETARGAIAAAGHKVSVAAFDVTDQKAVEAGIARIEAEIGPIDVLVNNAGTQKRGAFVDFPAEDWHFLMATNLHSVFYVTQAVAKRMAPRGRARSSISAR